MKQKGRLIAAPRQSARTKKLQYRVEDTQIAESSTQSRQNQCHRINRARTEQFKTI